MVKGQTAVGVDIAFGRPCVAVALGDDFVVTERHWMTARHPKETAAMIDWIVSQRPLAVAIDAPQRHNHRLLLEAPECRFSRARACDYDLARRRLSVYQVPTKAEIDEAEAVPRHLRWMQVGWDYFSRLRRKGFAAPEPGTLPAAFGAEPALLEVYPYASFAALLRAAHANAKLPPKTTRDGIAVRVEVLRHEGVRWDRYYDHDSLDALAAALTARRFLDGQTHHVGRRKEGLIWLPVTRGRFESAFPAPPLAVLGD